MSVTPPAARADRLPPLWRNVSFQLTWTSVAASGFGDRMIQLAAWSVLGIGSQEVQASSVAAAAYLFFFLPYVLLAPFTGWLADRLPRKWILLSCDELRALLLLGAFLWLSVNAASYSGGPVPSDHPLAHQATYLTFGILAAVGVLAAFFNPARNAIVPQLVPLPQLQSANAIILGIAIIASLIGLGVGGWLIKSVSVRAAVAVGVGMYGISGWFFAFLRVRGRAVAAEPGISYFKRLQEAVLYVGRHRRVVELLLLSLLFWSLAAVVLGALAALCGQQYDVASEDRVSAIAVLQMMLGAGMLASSLLFAWRSALRESQWIAMGGLLAGGVMLAGLWLNDSYAVALVLAAGLGFFSNINRICVDTLTQTLTPNFVRGRVFGLREILTTGAAVIVHFIVWQTNSDRWMVATLPWLSLLLLVVGTWGLWRLLRTGPMQPIVNVFWRITRAYVLYWHQLRWSGEHHVPAQGPVILASNHTTGLDGLVIQAALPRLVRWVMLKSYLLPGLGPMWRRIQPIALESNGTAGLGQLRQILRALEQGEVVGLFPEGRLQRSHRELQPFEPGIGMIARRAGAPIVPVWISGTPRARNMFWHFLLPSRSSVRFGRPYRPDISLTNEQVAAELRRRTLELGDSG